MNNNVRVRRAIGNVLEKSLRHLEEAGELLSGDVLATLEKSLRHLEEAGELLGDTGDIDSKELDEAADAILVAIRKIWQYMGELDDLD